MNGLDNSDNKKEDAGQIGLVDSLTTVKRCSICANSATYKEKTRWGMKEHWYGKSENPICKKCYVRIRHQEKYIPRGVKCDKCNCDKTILSKYGTPMWVKNRDREGGYLCWSCYTIKNNTGKVFSQERKANISAGIRQAVDAGKIFGRKIYTINELAFDLITEESAYWVGFFMADANMHSGKTGNPRIAIALKNEDYGHLVKLAKFLKCTYKILEKRSKIKEKTIIQFTLRFSSKHIAESLMKLGVIPNKSIIAKVIGLENNRHFWRGVVDGDGWIGLRNGQDGDKIILTGSHGLLNQFKTFIELNVPGSIVRIKQEGKYSRLYIYSYTARAVAKLLYNDCSIALDRKLIKAQMMYQ